MINRFLLLAMFALFPAVAQAKTWTVCAALCDATNLVDAITKAAASGDTISIIGTTSTLSRDNVIVNKSVTIRNDTVDPTNLGAPYRVILTATTTEAIVIDGVTASFVGPFEIRPAKADKRAVHAKKAANVTFSDTWIRPNPSGVTLDYTADGVGLQLTEANTTVTLTNSRFENLATSTKHGGGIEMKANTSLTLTSTTITGCAATAGGAIYVDTGTVVLSAVTLDGNSATGAGGGVWSKSSTVTIGGSSVLVSNVAATLGGAIYTEGSTVLGLDAVQIGQSPGVASLGNSADTGGGVYAGGLTHMTTTASTVFDDNHATSAGGAIAAEKSGGGTNTLTATGTRFTTNVSDNMGGAVAILGGASGVFHAVDFGLTGDSNQAQDLGGDASIDGSSSMTADQGTAFDGATATAANSAGGSIYVEGTLDLDDVTFDANAADQGGSIYAYTGSTVQLDAVTIDSSTAGSGGAIAALGAILGIADSSFSGDVATDTASTGVEGGGAIWLDGGSDVAVDGSTFSGCTSGAHGGAIYVNDSALGITTSEFDGNSAAVDGGAIATWTSDAVAIASSNFKGNSAMYGGAVDLSGLTGDATVTIATCDFQGNTASFNGGAIRIFDDVGPFTLNDSTFGSNTAATDGGALWVGNAGDTTNGFTVRRNTFCGNLGTTGGAVLIGNLTGTSTTNALTNNLFAANGRSNSSGGALRVSDTGLLIANNDFVTNQGGLAAGGGVRLSKDATVENNIFAYTVTGDGLAGSTTTASLVVKNNDLFQNNAVGTSGTITLGTGNVTTDPQFFAYAPSSACTSDFRVRYDGPMRNAGDTAAGFDEADGTDADIGYTGGPSVAAAFLADGDGDGFAYRYDCDDTNSAIKPGATETCNGIDDDCDGAIDDGATAGSWYTDADADGYGTGAVITSCAHPGGTAGANGDCADNDANRHPGATEACNNLDDDCDGQTDEGVTITVYTDGDADGYGAGAASTACTVVAGKSTVDTDCADADPNRHPGATEVCNNLDDDCDGQTDEGTTITVYRDADGDGFGTPSNTISACAQGGGYVLDDTDCNDASAAVNPSATETCNSIDDNCDGQTDEGAIGPTWYADADADTYGNAASSVQRCTAPAGSVASSTDCNDANNAIHPGATEVCNGVDDNCNGTADEGVGTAYYADADADTYGNLADVVYSCSAVAGRVTNSTDCDDTRAAVHPGVAEACNGRDDDCDGQVDEGLALSTFHADSDQDGYGTSSSSVQACTAPPGTVADGTDCNDANAGVHPGAAEVCNTVDDDCDAAVDENVTTRYYADTDADGYGNSASHIDACTTPAGHVVDATDCDDTRTSVHPGATETCNNRDDDCDGTIDENVKTTYYADADADGFGNVGDSVLACTAPGGRVLDGTDCNDLASTVHPGAPELCNGVDDDCDGTIDDSPTNPSTWYADADHDGHGATAPTAVACTAPVGFVASSDDCDDAVATTFTGAPEQCNGVDDDCDGTIDDATVTSDWFADTDGDGYGDATDTVANCLQPAGYVLDDADCNDGDAAVHPGVPEVCDGVDQDCDGTTDGPGSTDAVAWYLDDDADGFGDPAQSTIDCDPPSGYVADDTDCDDTDASVTDGADWWVDADRDGYADETAPPIRACTQPSGTSVVGGDCDDADASILPGAAEHCDGVDEDCDGVIDDNPVDARTWYADADNDAAGDPSQSVTACTRPIGHVGNAGDCDDANALVRPGAPEQCNSIDDDCNGLVDDDVVIGDWYSDLDGDGYGDSDLPPVQDCLAPPDTVDRAGDCDDDDANVNPNAIEDCNSIDDDCDGLVDDGAIGASVWFEDADGDGRGSDGAFLEACDQPTGFVDVGGDCDDTDPLVSPDQPEICDNQTDDDCDGVTDADAVTTTWYLDADGDGIGVADDPLTICGTPPEGYVLEDGDCDDTDATIYPSAPDDPDDGIDSNCDGVDEAIDLDGDGYSSDDCDDGDASIHPGAEEIPGDDIDQDCDGEDVFPDTGGRPWAPGDSDAPAKAGGCDCDHAPSAGLGLVGLLGLAALVRRRRSG
jgi:MYXO-CTERM domain-containing protein